MGRLYQTPWRFTEAPCNRAWNWCRLAQTTTTKIDILLFPLAPSRTPNDLPAGELLT